VDEPLGAACSAPSAEFLDVLIETVATAEADHPFRNNRYPTS
jgi:hypothetical protein